MDKLPIEILSLIIEFHSHSNLAQVMNQRDYKHLVLIAEFTRLPSICMHMAAQQQDPRLIKILITFGLDINYQDDLGITPLYISLVLRNYEILLLLIQNGASTTLKTLSGTTIQQIARMQGRLWLNSVQISPI